MEKNSRRSPVRTILALCGGLAILAVSIPVSLVATFAPGVFPAEYRMGHGVGTYYEAAVVIVALIFVGQVLDPTAG